MHLITSNRWKSQFFQIYHIPGSSTSPSIYERRKTCQKGDISPTPSPSPHFCTLTHCIFSPTPLPLLPRVSVKGARCRNWWNPGSSQAWEIESGGLPLLHFCTPCYDVTGWLSNRVTCSICACTSPPRCPLFPLFREGFWWFREWTKGFSSGNLALKKQLNSFRFAALIKWNLVGVKWFLSKGSFYFGDY